MWSCFKKRKLRSNLRVVFEKGFKVRFAPLDMNTNTGRDEWFTETVKCVNIIGLPLMECGDLPEAL